MRVIVSDANILIDLVELGLLDGFFALKYDFHTTSLVFEELEESQQLELKAFVSSNVLRVAEMTTEQLSDIHRIQQTKPSLSPQDCSAFYQAQLKRGILVTSDNKLRRIAKEQKLDVHGHLWVFDQMFEARTISAPQAIEKLKELNDVVNRKLGLPKTECNKRIRYWSDGL